MVQSHKLTVPQNQEKRTGCLLQSGPLTGKWRSSSLLSAKISLPGTQFSHLAKPFSHRHLLLPSRQRFAELYFFVVCCGTFFQLHTFSPTSTPREDRLQTGPLSKTHTVYSLINSSPDQVPQRKETCKIKTSYYFQILSCLTVHPMSAP